VQQPVFDVKRFLKNLLVEYADMHVTPLEGAHLVLSETSIGNLWQNYEFSVFFLLDMWEEVTPHFADF
jgi:hypothetical protein